jgi:hypothetical protein
MLCCLHLPFLMHDQSGAAAAAAAGAVEYHELPAMCMPHAECILF